MSLLTSKTKSDYFGIGRRKTSVAKVILVPGKGTMVINHKKKKGKYLQFNLQYINASKSPLMTLGLENTYSIYVITHGGGLRGQADAIKLGVARALCYVSPKNRKLLKGEGVLTCDSRQKERKKYGLKKARKSPQFSKR